MALNLKEKISTLYNGEGRTIVNSRLSNCTWIKRGGVVDLFVEPTTLDELIEIVRACCNNNLTYMVIGHSSNLYFLENNLPNVVISSRKLESWEIKEDGIHCQCGCRVKRLAKYCVDNSIAGFSGFTDLPGTIGGAVVNNSSCFGSIISDIFEYCTFIDNTGNISTLTKSEMKYEHRNSIIKKGELKGVILEIVLSVRKGDREELQQKAFAAHKKRMRTQEGPAHNLGSTYAEVAYTKKAAFVMRQIDRVVRIFHLKNGYRWKKKVLLLYYGYNYLDRYISDRNINCFIWKDDNADNAFLQYQSFINRISTSNRLEIQLIGTR